MRLKHSTLSENQTLRLCEHFVAGTPARGRSGRRHKNTAALFYHRLREIIAARIADESPIHGEVELDESYFGGRRKGKRGRGAAGKVAVFGILKRGGRVYTTMLPNVSRTTLVPIINTKVTLDSMVYTDGYFAYDNLDVSGFRHRRINHQHTPIARETTSTASRTSGTRPSGICASATASPSTTSISSSKSANGASTTARLQSSSQPSKAGSSSQITRLS